VTAPWSLTITAPGRIDTTIGIVDDHDGAVSAVLAAAQAAVDDARVSAAPAARYELRAAAELVAIIATAPMKTAVRITPRRARWCNASSDHEPAGFDRTGSRAGCAR
jgi:hypothetical protein